jgi:hypothetical protein
MQLQHVSLDEDPQYQALSYIWGDQNVREYIFFDGLTLSVTTNLVSALRHLRDSTKPLVLWADAMCINENHMEERNHQVQIMASIYKKASRVIGWLGVAAEDSDIAIKLVSKMAEEIKKEKESFIVEEDTTPSLRTEISAVEDMRSKRGKFWLEALWESYLRGSWDTLDALAALMERSYWRRLWILQEMVLADDLIFMCGPRIFVWDDIRTVASTVGSTEFITRCIARFSSGIASLFQCGSRSDVNSVAYFKEKEVQHEVNSAIEL